MTRESPWGPLQVADAHVHLFTHRFFRALAAQKPGLSVEAVLAHLGTHAPPEDPVELAAQWVQELDRVHVSHAALIASVPGDEGSAVAAVQAFPDRFFAYAMVNPRAWNPENFEQVDGVCLFPAMHCYAIHDPVVQPVLEWAAEKRRAVFVHCGVLSVGIRARLGIESYFDMRYSNPIDLHAVALRYPSVTFVVPHFGAGYFREALMLVDLCSNVCLDTSSSNRWMLYQESHLDLRNVFRRALAVAGPSRLVFGTDSSVDGWSARIFEEQATALYEIGLSVSDAQSIFGANLLRILRRAAN